MSLPRWSETPAHRHDDLSDPLTNAAGYTLVAAVFLAPWAFGSRPYWAALGLAAWLSLAEALWACGWLWKQRLPRVPALCVAAVVLLGALAGISILNPRSAFDVARGMFVPNLVYLPFLPGTVDVATGWSFTVEMLAYLLVVPTVADLARSPRWQRSFMSAIASTGFLLSVAGLILKLGGLPSLDGYLRGRVWVQGEIFGPFDYHGNAGAFLNLALPAAAWKAASQETPARKLFWQCAVVIFYVALFANSSRAALVIGLLLSPFCLWLMLRGKGIPPVATPPDRRKWIFRVGVPAVLLGIGVLTVDDYVRPVRRLRHLSVELREPEYPRYMQSRAAWEMARERPLFGAGVGTYKVWVQTSSIRRYFFAPSFRPGDPFTVLGNTHEDYLQTLAEWGWIGFGAWTVLVAGAFVCLWRWLWQTRFTTRTGLAISVALGSVYLHAAGDCPLQIPAIQCCVAVYLGLAWGSPQARRSSTAVNV